MLDRVLGRLRQKVRARRYVMTLHAEEEMNEDRLSVSDVESAVLTGAIVERQKDGQTGELKYRVRGESLAAEAVEVVVKIGPTGKVVVITVYLV